MTVQDLLVQLDQVVSDSAVAQRVAIVRGLNPRAILHRPAGSPSDWVDEDETFREFDQFQEKDTP